MQIRIAICTLGLVLGASTATPAQGFLDQLEGVLDRDAAIRRAGEKTPDEAAKPAGTPGYLGLIAEETDLGLIVETVREGGPAALAGVRTGDRLVALDGAAVLSLDAMSERLAGRRAGERLILSLQRGEERLICEAMLAPRPAAAAPAPPETAPIPPAAALPAKAPPTEKSATVRELTIAPADAAKAIDELEKLLAAPDAKPAAAPRISKEQVDRLEQQLGEVRRRIAELQRELAALGVEK